MRELHRHEIQPTFLSNALSLGRPVSFPIHQISARLNVQLKPIQLRSSGVGEFTESRSAQPVELPI